jgi:hypothetical protein
MPPANNCPRCGRLSPANTTFCSGCGATLSSPSSGKGWKLFLGAFALFTGLLWASLIYTQPRPAALPDAASPARALTAPAPPATPSAARPSPRPLPSPVHTSARHLARKKAQAGGAESDEAAADNEDDEKESSSAAPARQRPPAPAPAAGDSSSDDYYTNSRGQRVHRPVISPDGPPAGATAQCRDGSYSFSQSRRGTCSHHGGVSRWL